MIPSNKKDKNLQLLEEYLRLNGLSECIDFIELELKNKKILATNKINSHLPVYFTTPFQLKNITEMFYFSVGIIWGSTEEIVHNKELILFNSSNNFEEYNENCYFDYFSKLPNVIEKYYQLYLIHEEYKIKKEEKQIDSLVRQYLK
jgi:hypothetical protein